MTGPHPQPERCIHECVQMLELTKCCHSELLDILEDVYEHPATHTPAAPVMEPKFNSTDLLLLANDEWKRREERKHNHENIPWCAGFINGFLTDKKWARGWVDKIQKDAESLRGGA
jgi:hypothetical protein